MKYTNDFSENNFGDPHREDQPAGIIRLADLFPSATRTGSGEVVVTSCVTDWREVQPGDVYVALPDTSGFEDDGHTHAQRAVSHGAIAVVCE